MANDQDDDLLASGSFLDDDDKGEFTIPDDQDGDILGDDFELTDDDVVVMSDAQGIAESDDFFSDQNESGDYAESSTDGFENLDAAQFDESHGADNEQHGDALASPGTHDQGYDESESAPEKSGLGWKAWVGLALFAITASGGLAYTVLPSDGSAQSASQQNLPKPPPPPAQAGRGNSGLNPQGSTASSQAPVQVSPFPDSNVSGGAGTGDQGFDSATMGGSGIQDPSMAPPPADREPAYLAGLEEQREDFSQVASIANENMFRLTQMEKRFNEFEKDTTGELGSLDRRVSELENMMKTGSQPNKGGVDASDSNPKGERKAASGNRSDGFVYKVPKSPAEIKDLQRTLKNYGYRPGKVDGILGDQTRWAIKRLQEEHGLPVTGWLSAETMMALENPKHYSGTYPKPTKKATAKAATNKPAGGRMVTPTGSTHRWFVRGVTPTKAIVYRQDGMSYAVNVGTEIPGMGQVTELDTENVQVVTAKGTITRR